MNLTAASQNWVENFVGVGGTGLNGENRKCLCGKVDAYKATRETLHR